MIRSKGISLYKQGFGLHQKEREKAEKEKAQELRIGDAGCFVAGPKGQDSYVGKCLRLAALRYLGWQEDHSFQKCLMFDGGIGNESVWERYLRLAVVTGATVKSDVEAGFKLDWHGSTISGRPDLTIIEKDGRKHGIELKRAYSIWTARNLLEFKPPISNLIQAGNYARLGGYDSYEVIFTYREQGSITKNKWSFGEAKANFPEAIDSKYVLPFVISYPIQWTDGVLQVSCVDDNQQERRKWTETIITEGGCDHYWEQVKQVAQVLEEGTGGRSQLLGPPDSVSATGEKLSFDHCDYCSLKDLCNGHCGNTVAEWLRRLPASFRTL
jgi:hypothetical protein